MNILRALSIAFAITIFCHFAAAQTPSVNPSIEGTWELLAQRTGRGPMVDVSASNKRKEIKLIVDHYFLWTIYDLKRRTPDTVAGGTYALVGNSYVERLEFASPRLAIYVGHDQRFTVQIDGDRLVQTGVLSDGTELQEIWARKR